MKVNDLLAPQQSARSHQRLPSLSEALNGTPSISSRGFDSGDYLPPISGILGPKNQLPGVNSLPGMSTISGAIPSAGFNSIPPVLYSNGAYNNNHPANSTVINPYPSYVYESNPAPQRKRRQNLPKEVTDILLEWLKLNLDRPYPNSHEKQVLVNKTGLSAQQLDNWFINARRRKVKALKQSLGK